MNNATLDSLTSDVLASNASTLNIVLALSIVLALMTLLYNIYQIIIDIKRSSKYEKKLEEFDTKVDGFKVVFESQSALLKEQYEKYISTVLDSLNQKIKIVLYDEVDKYTKNKLDIVTREIFNDVQPLVKKVFAPQFSLFYRYNTALIDIEADLLTKFKGDDAKFYKHKHIHYQLLNDLISSDNQLCWSALGRIHSAFSSNNYICAEPLLKYIDFLKSLNVFESRLLRREVEKVIAILDP